MAVKHVSGCPRGNRCSCPSSVQCPAVYVAQDNDGDTAFRCTLEPVHRGDHDPSSDISWYGRKSWRDPSCGVTYGKMFER